MSGYATTNDKRVRELLSLLDFKDPCTRFTIEFLPNEIVKVNAELYMTDDGMDKLVEIFKEGKIVDKETSNGTN